MSAVDDPLIPVEMPGYFVDRYAFEVLVCPPRWRVNEIPGLSLISPTNRAQKLREFLRSSAALGGWRADPDSKVELSPFYGSLRSGWAAYAARKQLPDALQQIPDATGWRWIDVFNDSVFYPGRPAIPGPIFADLMDECDRAAAAARFGPGYAVDFYCFLQQVHESIHKAQLGEPLLNEIVQASLWIDFLNSYPQLWALQRNTRTNVCAVREYEAVSSLPGLARDAVVAKLDTARLVDMMCHPGTYFRCCMLAARFDRRKIRYATYLLKVSRLLHHRARVRA